jgi:hypothetical protein
MKGKMVFSAIGAVRRFLGNSMIEIQDTIDRMFNVI